MRGFVLALALALAGTPVLAQDGGRTATLADLRSELGQLTQDLQALRSELVSSGSYGFAMAGGDSAIDRMNAMEARLAQLTGQTEQLQNRIDRVVKDGTTRIGDIEFRLCEMEPNCDFSTLNTPTLGEQGAAAPAAAPTQHGSLGDVSAPRPATNPTAGAATVAEKAAFDRAQEVLGQGDFRTAADLFAAVAQTYAGGPLTAQALYLRGAALDSAGELTEAGVAWLESFAADPNGPQAPDALLGLSRATAAVGTATDGCPYLYEIISRFPDTAQSAEAAKRIAQSSCDTAQPEAEFDTLELLEE